MVYALRGGTLLSLKSLDLGLDNSGARKIKLPYLDNAVL